MPWTGSPFRAERIRLERDLDAHALAGTFDLLHGGLDRERVEVRHLELKQRGAGDGWTSFPLL